MIYLVMVDLIILVFPYLIYQSKRPSGFVGLWMVKIWNRVYMPMAVWPVISQLIIRRIKAILDVGVGNELSKYLKNAFS